MTLELFVWWSILALLTVAVFNRWVRHPNRRDIPPGDGPLDMTGWRR